MANFIVLQAIYAKIVKSIQARGIQAELGAHVEVRRKLELGTKENWNTAEILQGCEFSQPAFVSSLTHFDHLFVTFS